MESSGLTQNFTVVNLFFHRVIYNINKTFTHKIHTPERLPQIVTILRRRGSLPSLAQSSILVVEGFQVCKIHYILILVNITFPLHLIEERQVLHGTSLHIFLSRITFDMISPKPSLSLTSPCVLPARGSGPDWPPAAPADRSWTWHAAPWLQLDF